MIESRPKKLASKAKQTKPKYAGYSRGKARSKVLCRHKALCRVQQLLGQTQGLSEEAIQLIDLFQFHSDDLTEAGISYEMVCAIERRYPLLLQG